MLTSTAQLGALRPVPLPGGGLVSPFQFLLSGAEHLRVEVFNAASGVEVAVQGRTVDEKGGPTWIRHTIIPTSDRAVSRQNFPLGPGALLNLTAFAASGAPKLGQTFVRVQLILGLSGATVVLGTLMQGYVTARQDIAYPGSPLRMSTEDAFPIRTILGTNPFAGDEIVEQVPTGARWELVSFFATLVTNATAGTRRPFLWLQSSAGTIALPPFSGTQDASETINYQAYVGGLGYAGAGGQVMTGALPHGPALSAGDFVATNTPGLLAADNWGAPVLCVREQLEVG